MKKFKNLFESVGSPANDSKVKEDDEEEVKGYKPRSKGEEDFVNQHKVVKKEHPAAEPHQHTGDRKGPKSDSGEDHEGFEKKGEPVLKTYDQFKKMGGFGGNSYKGVGNSGGEKAPVMQGSSKIKEETELDEAKMSASQIAALKKAYEPMRGKKISMDSGNKLRSIMDKVNDDKQALIQLVKADIPFVSSLAVTRLISKHGMKGAEINKLKEEVELDEATYSYKAATFNGNVVKGSGSTKEAARKDAEDKAKALGSTIRKRLPEEADLDEVQKPYVSSDRDGKHVMNSVGKIDKSFKDMESASNYLRKHYKRLAAVREEVELDEAFKVGVLKLKDGSTVKVNEATAKVLNNALSQLNASNKKRMEAEAMKNKSSFESMVKFAKATV